MKKFKDNEKRDWEIAINVGTVERVREGCGVNLLRLFEDKFKLLVELEDDPILLTKTLYFLVKPQADEAGLTFQDFAASLVGDALGEAHHAMIDDLVDFFSDPRKREIYRQAIQKTRELTGALYAEAEKAVNEITPEQLLAKLNEQSGSVPASSASIPVRLRSTG